MKGRVDLSLVGGEGHQVKQQKLPFFVIKEKKGSENSQFLLIFFYIHFKILKKFQQNKISNKKLCLYAGGPPPPCLGQSEVRVRHRDPNLLGSAHVLAQRLVHNPRGLLSHPFINVFICICIYLSSIECSLHYNQ